MPSPSGNRHMNACSYCDGDNFVLRCVFIPMYLRENGARNERVARQLIGLAFVQVVAKDFHVIDKR